MKPKRKYVPNVVSGGTAIPLGDNYFYMKGRKHKNGGIDIGENPKTGLEVEDGEVMHISKDSVKVFSSVPFLNGKSPAQKVLGGENPNEVFKDQESFKDKHKLNDDGTTFKNGGKKYIGGNKYETREKYINLDKKLIQAVSQVANEYNISPQLLMQRISDEGIVDQAIRNYNNLGGKDVKSIIDLHNINGFNSFGLDWTGKEYKDGSIKTNRKIPFQLGLETNERDEDVISANTLNAYDAIELMASVLKSRQDYIKEKYPNIEDIDAATSAAYNRGIAGSRNIIKNKSYKNKYAINDYIKNINFPDPLPYNIPGPLNHNNPNKPNVIYTGTDYLPQENESDELYSEPYGTNADYYNPVMEMDGTLEKKLDENNINIVKDLMSNYMDKKVMGGLSRSKDYGSKSKPYPSVKSKDFAGGHRSYPIPTKADAIDALRLAGLHGRNDIRTKVYNKYPELKKDKKEMGGITPTHKLVEVNINGNKKLIRVPSFTGDRKKAAGGTEINRKNYDSIISKPKELEIRKQLIGDTTLEPVNKVIKRSNPILYDYSTYEVPEIEPTDYISLGVNTIGSIGDFISNRKSIKNMEYSKQPIPIKSAKLKTSININPQLDRIREDREAAYKDIDDNTISSRVATARKGRIRMASQLATNELYGNKENLETQLINQDKLNQQQVDANNIAAYNSWRQGKAEFNNRKREMLAENTTGLLTGLSSGVQDIISRVEQRKALNKNLGIIAAANPNVSAELLRELGIKGIYKKRYR